MSAKLPVSVLVVIHTDALDVLLLEGGLVREIMTFNLAAVVDAFGLPREL